MGTGSRLPWHCGAAAMTARWGTISVKTKEIQCEVEIIDGINRVPKKVFFIENSASRSVYKLALTCHLREPIL